MSHEVEKMAYVGETPWHGLGEALPGDIPFDEWFIHSGLNWQVRETPVLFESSDETRIFKGQKVLFRSDTLRPLSVVSDRYNVVQPADVLEFYRSLVEEFGFSLETAGVLREGKRVWALARTNGDISLLGTDNIRSYLLLATSYDGTFATTAQPTDVRVVCRNTLHRSLNSAQVALKIPHNTKFDAANAKVQLGLTQEMANSWQLTLETLARCKISAATASHVLKNALRLPEVITSSTDKANQGHYQKILDMFEKKEFMGSDLEAANETTWGLVNCVTEYIDFKKRARTQASRLDNAWFGEGAALKTRTVQECLKVAA